MFDYRIYIPETIDVLGISEEGRILIWSSVNRDLYEIEDFGQINRPKLIQMASLEAVMIVEAAIRQAAMDVPAVSLIRDAIAEECRQHKFVTSENIGQGVWRSPEGDGLLLVTGNDSLVFRREGGRIRWQNTNRPTSGTRLIQFGRQWVQPQALYETIGGLTHANINATWKELVTLFGCWNFTQRHDPLLIAGLVVGTCIQGALTFRPQVSVTGKSYTGKTTLKKLLHRLWPYADLLEGRSSEAAIRQSTGCNALPILFDEMENWHGRQAVYNLLRSSSSGAAIKKGSPTQKVIEFRMSHIFWTFAIDAGVLQEADNNRFARFTLRKLDVGDGEPPRPVLPNLNDPHAAAALADLGRRLLAIGMIYAGEIMAMQAALAADDGLRPHGRLVEVYSLPVAAYLAVNRLPLTVGQEILWEVLAEKSAILKSKSVNDEQKLLEDILHSIPRGGTSPIIKMIADAGWDYEPELANVGIKKITDKNAVFFAHSIITKSKLLGPEWAGADVGEYLGRLEGAQSGKRLRINKRLVYGVLVPMDVLVPAGDEDVDDVPF